MKRTYLLSCLLVAAFETRAMTSCEPPEPPGRGRAPFVFRAIFEDKPRMCLVALRPGLTLAYDPATCALERACGGTEFRGKVYDFSQQNTKALAPAWYTQPVTLLALADSTTLPAGFEANGVVLGESLRFESDGASLVSPRFDVTKFTNVMVLFDERSRRAPFRVEVIGDPSAEPLQWFESTRHRDSDKDWQENLKRIAPERGELRLRFSQTSAKDQKELRRVRVFGAFRAWSARRGVDNMAVTPDWGGYVRSGSQGNDAVTLLYSLVLEDGVRVAIEERPEVLALDDERAAIERRFRVTGLPPNTRLHLSLAGSARDATYRVWGAASLRESDAATVLAIEADGECGLEQWWGKP